MGKIVDTLEDQIQNAFLTSIGSTITPKTKMAVRSINAASTRDATNVMAKGEHRECKEFSLFFGNASERKDTLHEFNANDETGNSILDEVSELSVPRTHCNLCLRFSTRNVTESNFSTSTCSLH